MTYFWLAQRVGLGSPSNISLAFQNGRTMTTLKSRTETHGILLNILTFSIQNKTSEEPISLQSSFSVHAILEMVASFQKRRRVRLF